MEFLFPFAFQVLSLDPLVTGRTYTPIQFVVVTFAVWRIVDHVEGRGLKGFRASLAYEALLVVPSSQTAISGGNRFPFDSFTAAFAITLRGCWATNGLVLRRAEGFPISSWVT
jgi:hypothetical protein